MRSIYGYLVVADGYLLFVVIDFNQYIQNIYLFWVVYINWICAQTETKKYIRQNVKVVEWLDN